MAYCFSHSPDLRNKMREEGKRQTRFGSVLSPHYLHADLSAAAHEEVEMKPAKLFLLVVLFLAACALSTTLEPAPTAQATASFGMPTATPKLPTESSTLLLCCSA